MFWAKRLMFWAKRPVFWAKRPVFWAKRPVFWAKRPVFWAKRPVGARDLVVIAGVLPTLATVVACADRTWWVFDLVAHFRVQYLVALAVLAIAAWTVRRPRSAIVFAIAGAVNLVPFLPFLWPGPQHAATGGPVLRVALLNLHTANLRYEDARRAIRAADPDLLLLLEVNADWMRELEPLSPMYAHRVARVRADNFGIVLLSRLPLVDGRVMTFGEAGVPSILARVAVGGEELTLLGTHPVPPVGAEGSAQRNLQLQDLAAYLARVEGRVLLVGDLNCTPWSVHFKRLLRDTGLANSAVGRGIQPTWPVPLFPLMIPIDHCLVSNGIRILGRETGPPFGSDHRPIFVECELVDWSNAAPR